jgi:hypothetical protein
MSQYWSSGKGLLQGLESRLAIVGEIPFDSFPGESGKRNSDIGVVVNEVSIEVSKLLHPCNTVPDSGLWTSGTSLHTSVFLFIGYNKPYHTPDMMFLVFLL